MNRTKSGISGSILDYSDLKPISSNRIKFVSNLVFETVLDDGEYEKIVFKKFTKCQQYPDINLCKIKTAIQKQLTNINDSDNYCKVIGEIANNILVINSLLQNGLDLAPFYVNKKNEIVLFAVIKSSQGYELMSVYQKFQGDIWDAKFFHRGFIEIISYLLHTVSALHRSGYYHLDIKLSNILYDELAEKTRYSLCDFGSLSNIECDNTHRGTRPYMSPLIDFNKQEFKNHYLKLLKKPVTNEYFESYKDIRKIQMHVVIPYFESVTEGSEPDISEIYNPEIVQIMKNTFNKPPYHCILDNYLSGLPELKSTAMMINELILQKVDLHAIGISLLALAEKNSLIIDKELYQWIHHIIFGSVELDYYTADSAKNDFLKI